MKSLAFAAQAILGIITLWFILGFANVYVALSVGPNGSGLTYLVRLLLFGVLPLLTVTAVVHKTLRWRGFTFAVLAALAALTCVFVMIAIAGLVGR